MSQDTIAEVLSYLDRGWVPIPIPRGDKRPNTRGWQNLKVTKDTVGQYFTNSSNVGILLGDPSRGLVDVDLDALEARELADTFLPQTGCIFGRPSAPRSHRIYQVQLALRTEQFHDVDGAMLVEIRSTGAQTLFPPSVHPSGEEVTFSESSAPASVDGNTLRECVKRLAAASILARHWSRNGSRQDTALALTGALTRLGWEESQINEFIFGVALAAGDDEVQRRASVAHYSAQRLTTNQAVRGWPSLAGIVGRQVVDRVRALLGAKPHPHGIDLSPSLLSLPDMLALQLPPRARHLAWLQAGSNSMVYGFRGVGKTMFGLELMASLVTGKDFLKWPVTEPVGVLYVDGEMPLAELRERVAHLLPEEPQAPVFFLTSEMVYHKQDRDLVLTGEEMRQALTDMLDAHPEIKVVILDNISCLFAGIPENAKDDWEPINAWLIRLRHRGLSTILVHHEGKSGLQRGTTGREDALDTVIRLSFPTGYQPQEGCHFELNFTKSRSIKGDEVAPLDVKLIETNGEVQWVCTPLEESMEAKVRQLMAQGMTSLTDLAEELRISKGYACKLRKKAGSQQGVS